MTGPRDPAAARRDRLRAGHADREQMIETLKTAFVHGRLTRDELDMRVGRALAARTYADLAALTADIPPAPAPAAPARPPAPALRRPLARAAAGSGGCLAIAFGAMKLINLADPGAAPGSIPKALIGPLFILFAAAVITALAILVRGVAASVDQRRSRRQLPPRPGPGGHALEAGQSSSTGHGPALPPDRPDHTRADLRSDGSRPGWPHSSGRGARTPRGIRPVPDAV